MPLPTISHPTFNVVLPISKKNVTFRPFLVKEQKILLIANETKTKESIYNAIIQVVTNCTFGRHKVDQWPMLDLQYFFVKLRAKSINEVLELKLKCPIETCGADILFGVNFDAMEVITDPTHQVKIPITDQVGIVMKYPTVQMDSQFDPALSPVELEERLIKLCIDYVYDATQTYKGSEIEPSELDTLIDNLSGESYAKIQKFFSTMPKMEHKCEIVCKKCGHKQNLVSQDMMDFFL